MICPERLRLTSALVRTTSQLSINTTADTREAILCSTEQEAFNVQSVGRKVNDAGVWQAKYNLITHAIVDDKRSHGTCKCIRPSDQLP